MADAVPRTIPRRIQRRRSRGWKAPQGAIYVGRGSIWGNPFAIGADCGVFLERSEVLLPHIDRATSMRLYRDLLAGFVIPEMYPHGHGWMRRFKRHNMPHPTDAARVWLRGADLMCWCALCPDHRDGLPLGVTCEACAPCHADLLLEISNG